MSHCFAVGSGKDGNGINRVEVTRVFEYLRFRLDQKEVDICGDFFVYNQDSVGQPFRFLHRGSVEFENISDHWFTDDEYTPLFRALYERCGKLELDCQRKAVRLTPIDEEEEEYLILDSGFSRRLDGGTKNSAYTPFSLYETPVVPGRTRAVFRTRGKLEGLSYKILMPNDKAFSIYGGEILAWEIERNDLAAYPNPGIPNECDLNHYRDLLRDFVGRFQTHPQRYHVIIDCNSGEGQLRAYPLTPDLQLGCNREEILGKRIIWYWSETGVFWLKGQLNGLRLAVQVSD